MDKNNKSGYYFDIGASYAEKIGFLPELLTEGYYYVISDLLDESKADFEQEKKIKDSLESEFADKKQQIFDKNELIDRLNKQHGELRKCEEDIAGREIKVGEVLKKEIEELEVKKGNVRKEYYEKIRQGGGGEKGKMHRSFIIGLFAMLTMGLLMFYWAAWYNGVLGDVYKDTLSSIRDGGVDFYANVINPYFLLMAYEKGNYYALLLAFFLNSIPMGASFMLHKGMHDFELRLDRKNWDFLSIKKNGITLFSLFFSLVIDFILAYKIVEEIELLKVHRMGQKAVELNVFGDVSFYLIVLICFVTYSLWGYYLLKILHFNDFEYEIKKIESGFDSAILEVRKKWSDEIADIKDKFSKLEVKMKDVLDKIDEAQKAMDIIKDESLGVEVKMKNFDLTMKLVKSDVEMVVNSFFSGFISSCINILNKKKSEEFIGNISQYKVEKDNFIKSILEDKRYVVI